MCSPHARGWSRPCDRALAAALVLPARAGMVPAYAALRHTAAGAPRTRGDGPATITKPVAGMVCSPHARGWSPVPPSPGLFSTVLPARAGMVPRPVSLKGSKHCAPRTRGDGPWPSAFLAKRRPWCSPHTRGRPPRPPGLEQDLPRSPGAWVPLGAQVKAPREGLPPPTPLPRTALETLSLERQRTLLIGVEGVAEGARVLWGNCFREFLHMRKCPLEGFSAPESKVPGGVRGVDCPVGWSGARERCGRLRSGSVGGSGIPAAQGVRQRLVGPSGSPGALWGRSRGGGV